MAPAARLVYQVQTDRHGGAAAGLVSGLIFVARSFMNAPPGGGRAGSESGRAAAIEFNAWACFSAPPLLPPQPGDKPPENNPTGARIGYNPRRRQRAPSLLIARVRAAMRDLLLRGDSRGRLHGVRRPLRLLPPGRHTGVPQ